MGKNKIILETFLKCHNCNGFKNANFTPKQKLIQATCFCGTLLLRKNKKAK